MRFTDPSHDPLIAALFAEWNMRDADAPKSDRGEAPANVVDYIEGLYDRQRRHSLLGDLGVIQFEARRIMANHVFTTAAEGHSPAVREGAVGVRAGNLTQE